MKFKLNLTARTMLTASTLLAVASLSGCAATGGSLNASGTESSGGVTLNVKMASSIFLQPVAPSKRVVFIEGHNTSSASGLNFKPELISDLKSSGYQLTDNPNKAEYMLMYNVRYVGKKTKSRTLQGALAGGYGGALLGAFHRNSNSSDVANSGFLGMAIGAGVGYFMGSNSYLMVVDVQLEQRSAGTVITTRTNASQGLGNSTVSGGSKIKGWQIYRDRIVASAKGTRLTFTVAQPLLTKTVAHELGGLF